MTGPCYGFGAVGEVPRIIAELGGTRVLLVCGERSFAASGAEAMLPDLGRRAEVRQWSSFEPNTTAEDLAEGLRVVADFKPDTVLGVGGGSAMDMAKLLCAYASDRADAEPGNSGPASGDSASTEPADTVPTNTEPANTVPASTAPALPLMETERLHDAIRTGSPRSARTQRLVLVPTTSGSGSEATHFAVVYIGAEKHSIAARELLPDAVVLDPALTLSGSAYQRATSGVDALSQAVESLWAVGGTAESQGYARRALRVLVGAIEDFVRAPDRANARAMAIGSHLAGRAINVSKTTAAHALSYGLTKGYGVSHGHAVALTLGRFIEAHADADPADLQPTITAERHERAMASVLAALDATDGAAARTRFTDLGARLGLPMRLAEIGLDTAEQVRALTASVNAERLGNNPVQFTADGLFDLIHG